MIDFPANPTPGQVFVNQGITWRWDGVKWTMGGTSPVYFGDSPPVNPMPGMMWWNTTVGQLYIWYVDPNTSQWVIAVNSGVAGPQGIKGDTGLQGPKGDTGATGPIGPPSGSGVYVPLAGGAMTGNLSAPGIIAPQVLGDNLIINGDMRIDQRNCGAAGTATGFSVDRWNFSQSVASKLRFQQVAGPAALGFPYCLQFTSLSAYAPVAADVFTVYQSIEADLASDLAWGTPGAQPATFSFYAASSIAGTFGGCVKNYTSAAPFRTYPFTFTLAANTWTYVTIPIPGDTAAGWTLSGNGGGVYAQFDLGSGSTYQGPPGAWAATNYIGSSGTTNLVATNGAYLAFTGVKLEVGTVATPYNRQSPAKSLADCQRYFERSYDLGTLTGTATGNGSFLLYISGLAAQANPMSTYISYKVQKRAAPTVTIYSPQTGAAGKLYSANATADVNSVLFAAGQFGISVYGSEGVAAASVNLRGQWTSVAEL
jgi:hypothetical protein